MSRDKFGLVNDKPMDQTEIGDENHFAFHPSDRERPISSFSNNCALSIHFQYNDEAYVRFFFFHTQMLTSGFFQFTNVAKHAFSNTTSTVRY